jgi:hypothetical protein
MKPSICKIGRRKMLDRKFVMALAVASLMSAAFTSPAFAQDDHDQERGQDRGQDRHHGRGDHRGYDRHDYRERNNYHARYDYGHPYYYSQPVYVPPTVYVEPRESPGISLFLPLNFRR